MGAAGLRTRVERLVKACVGSDDPRRLAPQIQRLSELFGAERSARRSDYMADPALRRAYLAFFVPQYAAKIAAILEQCAQEGLVDLPERPRVLDVGAGPLSGLVGAWLHRGALGESAALDLARRAMEAGRAILDEVAPGQPVRLVEQSVQARPLPGGPFDLVIVAHVLNELGDPRRSMGMRAGLVRALLGRLSPSGRLLIVEPATRVHGRALMALRDELASTVAVLSPCRGAAACPLLRTPGAWCHGDVSWERPPLFRELEESAGLRKDVLKSSHLLLAPIEHARELRSGLRLVGGVMTDRDGVERRYGCGARGLDVLEGSPRLPASVAGPLRGALLDPVDARVEAAPHREETAHPRSASRPSRGRRAPSAPTAAGSETRGGRGPGRRRRR